MSAKHLYYMRVAYATYTMCVVVYASRIFRANVFCSMGQVIITSIHTCVYFAQSNIICLYIHKCTHTWNMNRLSQLDIQSRLWDGGCGGWNGRKVNGVLSVCAMQYRNIFIQISQSICFSPPFTSVPYIVFKQTQQYSLVQDEN